MIIKFGILYICFHIMEILLCIILFSFINLFNNYELNSYIFNSYNVPMGLNFLRFMFYDLPLVIAFFLLFKFTRHFELYYKPILFSIFNTVIFVVLNFIYKLHRGLPSLEINEILFWVLVIPIFLSPIILGQIQYFNRLMNSFVKTQRPSG